MNFAQLPPEQRVAVVEGYVAKAETIPGPRLGAETRVLVYELKRAVCDDTLGEQGWAELRERWVAHLRWRLKKLAAANLRQAKAERESLLVGVREGRRAPRSTITFAALADEWLATRASGSSATDRSAFRLGPPSGRPPSFSACSGSELTAGPLPKTLPTPIPVARPENGSRL